MQYSDFDSGRRCEVQGTGLSAAKCRFVGVLITLLCVINPAAAHEVETRHGVIMDGAEGVSVEGGFTLTRQLASGSDIQNETLTSFDILSILPFGPGRLSVYLEGNTSAGNNAVSMLLPSANADAGTALNSNANGRLQLSEFHYEWPLVTGSLYAGLIDPTRFLDGSEIANDETRQFIATPLVNNPSIALPDYTLGFSWHLDLGSTQPGLLLFVGSSHGLADNLSNAYSDLVNVGATGKGVFAAAELFLPWYGLNIRPGVWVNSGDYSILEESGSAGDSYGIYTSIDGGLRSIDWNLRLGVAAGDAAEVNNFVALALEYPLQKAMLGVGVAYQGLSNNDSDIDTNNSVQAEAYIRLPLAGEFELTPSLQWLQHGDPAAGIKDVWVGSLRLSWSF